MPYKIDRIEGVGPAYAAKLIAVGITTTDELLDRCGHAAGRKETAAATGLSESTLLKWSNLADLMRIHGIGPQFSELLELTGVDTVKELRHRNAANLADAMAEANEKKKVARATPPVATVSKWVAAAKGMDPRISH